MIKNVLCCFLAFFALPLSGKGQSPSTLHWTSTDGNQYMEASGNDLHLKPRVDGKGPGVVTAIAKLSLPDTKIWQASFDIRFGVLRGQASSFHLLRQSHDIGWVGADDYYKKMGVFILNDNEVFVSAADTEWHHLSYICDGKTLTAKLDSKQVGSGPAQIIPDGISLQNSQIMNLPCHQEGIWVRNILVSDETQPAPLHSSDGTALNPIVAKPVATPTQVEAIGAAPINSAPPGRVSEVIALRSADTNVTCLVGDSLQISGTFVMNRDYDNWALFVDNVLVEQHGPTLGTDKYKFSWMAAREGAHLIQVLYTMQPNGKVVARRLWVDAENWPPVAFQSLPASAAVDIVATVVGAGSRPFLIARTDFYFQGNPVGTATVAPFSATLPIEAITEPGSYPVKFIAYDASGRPFYSHTSLIEVPQRVQPVIASEVAIQQAGDKVPVSATILPGVRTAKAAYWIAPAASDAWQPLIASVSAPFTASADLSAFASGTYQFKAKMTTISGVTYESPISTFNFKNVPDDDRKTKEAKIQADADAKVAARNAIAQADLDASEHKRSELAANLQAFLPRPGFDQKIFRQQLATLAFYDPQTRAGTIGTVHGLSVITQGGVPISGAPITVSALVRRGTGQVNFLANSEEDTKIAVQQAAEYCKMDTTNFRWDWSKYDITVGYEENKMRLGGSSAGLADAVSIISASLNMPVDNSVAMTGAISLRGDVRVVGGVQYKAESAFADTNVHTLIIPADSVPVDDLIKLYTFEPALCFNRRVVLVRTVNDALVESIVGWQRGDYVKAENLVQGGLRHFAAGEDVLALAAFSAAHALDPNNWTVTFWTAMVRITQSQVQKDLFAAKVLEAGKADRGTLPNSNLLPP